MLRGGDPELEAQAALIKAAAQREAVQRGTQREAAPFESRARIRVGRWAVDYGQQGIAAQGGPRRGAVKVGKRIVFSAKFRNRELSYR